MPLVVAIVSQYLLFALQNQDSMFGGNSKILSSVGAVSWCVRESIAKEQLGLDATALVQR